MSRDSEYIVKFIEEDQAFYTGRDPRDPVTTPTKAFVFDRLSTAERWAEEYECEEHPGKTIEVIDMPSGRVVSRFRIEPSPEQLQLF